MRLQENLLNRPINNTQTALSAAQFNQQYAAQCAVWQRSPLQIRPGQEMAYLELGNEEDFAAQAFLQTLQQQGVSIKKYDGKPADLLVAVCFSNYKAFKGHINLSAAEQAALSRAATTCKQSVFVSFGSPFGTEKIAALQARLFCFSPAEQMQVCAAEILLGKQTANGKMPV